MNYYKNEKYIEVVCDYSSPASLTRALKPFEDKLLVVNASSERNQPYYRKLIPHIPYLRTPSESSIVWATHKDQMRKLLSSYAPEISPRSIKITSENIDASLVQFKDAHYPLISKPVGLAASLLVNKAENFEELTQNVNASFKEIETIYTRNRGRGEPGIIVEEYMSGDMYSVDAYVDNVGSTWILPPVKVTTAASIGLEGYYSYAINSEHELSDEAVLKLNLVAAKSMHAIGLRNSVAHIELIDTPEGWKIIELGPRAGGYRQDMYALSYAIDHALNELLLKVGKEPIINTAEHHSSAVLNIYAEQEGSIEAIEGFDRAKEFTGIHRLSLHARAGDYAAFCGNGGNFLVDGVIFGENKEATDALSKQIRETIKIETKQ
jgi:biotin carboxylase